MRRWWSIRSGTRPGWRTDLALMGLGQTRDRADTWRCVAVNVIVTERLLRRKSIKHAPKARAARWSAQQSGPHRLQSRSRSRLLKTASRVQKLFFVFFSSCTAPLREASFTHDWYRIWRDFRLTLSRSLWEARVHVGTVPRSSRSDRRRPTPGERSTPAKVERCRLSDRAHQVSDPHRREATREGVSRVTSRTRALESAGGVVGPSQLFTKHIGSMNINTSLTNDDEMMRCILTREKPGTGDARPRSDE